MSTFKLWKKIITNPFEGFKDVNDNTKLALPLITIIIFFIIAQSIQIPILQSYTYSNWMRWEILSGKKHTVVLATDGKVMQFRHYLTAAMLPVDSEGLQVITPCSSMP